MNPIPCPYCGAEMRYEERLYDEPRAYTYDKDRLMCRAICRNADCPCRLASIFNEPCSACMDLDVPSGLDGERLYYAWECLRRKFAFHIPEIKRVNDARLARELSTQPR